MPAPYPVGNLTGAESLFQYVYLITDGISSYLIIGALWIVIFASFKINPRGYKTSDCMSIASLICMVAGAFLWLIDMLNYKAIVLLLIMTLLTTGWSLAER